MAMLKFDYNSVLDRLKNRVLKKLDGENLLLFSTNLAILEAAAEEFDDLAMYDEFLTRECVWETARGTSSIMKQVGFFNYKPHRKIGASGIVRFSIKPTEDNKNLTLPYSVRIPAFTKVSGGGMSFVTKEAGDLKAQKVSVDIPVVQGDIVSVSKSPVKDEISGYAQVEFDDDNIENTVYKVSVNGIEWTEVDDVRFSVNDENPSDAKVYSLKTKDDFSGVVIYFGNGLFGKAVNADDKVTFTYLQTKGKKGEILSSGVINSVDDKITAIDNNNVSVTPDIVCSNTSALMGGDDNESLDSIRINAPKTLQSNDRAISTSDYISLIKKAGITANVQVWREAEINEDAGNPKGTFIPFQENVIHITGYTVDTNTKLGRTLSAGNKDVIRSALNNKKGTTDILQFTDTQFLYVTFNADVYVSKTNYTESQVRDNVHNDLVKKYSVENAEYKKGVYKSDYISIIDGSAGVDHCTCDIEMHEFFSINRDFSIDIDFGIAVAQGSVSLLIRDTTDKKNEWKPFAREKDGRLVGEVINPEKDATATYSLSDAVITYSSGYVGKVTIISGLSGENQNYEIRADFKLANKDGDIEPKKRNQMVAWYSDNINIINMQ